MSESSAVALEDLLAEERRLILSAQYDSLAEVTQKKASALSALPQWKLPPARLSKVLARVQDNQLLLEAAINGVNAARARIDQLRKSAGSLSTYSSQGQMSEIGKPLNSIEKKA